MNLHFSPCLVHMKPMYALSLAILVLAVPCTAFGQFGAGGPSVTIDVVTETDAAHAGRPLRSAVVVTLQEGWHVNAHEPLDEFLIPTALRVDPASGITVQEIVYPEARTIRFSFSPDPMAVYEHTFAIGVTLRVPEDLSPGEYTLQGALTYQACNDKQCWAPTTKPVSIPVTVVDSSTVLKPQREDVFGNIPFAADQRPEAPVVSPGKQVLPPPVVDHVEAATPAGELQLLETFTVAGQAGGFMDTDTFLAFIDAAESGAVYSRPDRFAGKSFWWIAVLVLVGGLALNLTPCVLPVIPINLAIIGAGAQVGSRLRGFALGGVYGLAIALVYGILGLVVVLTTASFGAINASWLFNLAVAVLFVFLGLAMFDVITIDFSRFQSSVGTDKARRGPFIAAFMMGGVVALLAGACVAPVVISVVVFSRDLYAQGSPVGIILPFLLGVGMALPWPIAGAGMSMLPKPGKWMVQVKHVFGLFILGMALFYGKQAYGLFSDRYLVDKAAIQASVQAMDEEDWVTSLQEGLSTARNDNRPVLIDFWATWCKNCLVMNETTLKDPNVSSRLADYVKVKYQAEFPDQPPASDVLRRFDQYVGLPFYVILHPASVT